MAGEKLRAAFSAFFIFVAAEDVSDLCQSQFPLYWSVDQNSQEQVEALISAGCDVDKSRPSDGMTALMLAARKNSTSICRLLLDAGASKDLVNRRGLTAAQIAAAKSFLSLAALLQGQSVDATTQRNKLHGRSPQISPSSSLNSLSPSGVLSTSAPVSPRPTGRSLLSIVAKTDAELSITDQSCTATSSKSGTVLKKSGFLGRNWQPRRLVVDATTASVSYYTGDNSEARIVLPLKLVQVESAPDVTRRGETLYRFNVQSGRDKKLQFACDSVALRDEWVDCISRAALTAAAEKPTCPSR